MLLKYLRIKIFYEQTKVNKVIVNSKILDLNSQNQVFALHNLNSLIIEEIHLKVQGK